MSTSTQLNDRTMIENHEEPELRLYNTVTREKEPFRTVEPGRVGIYLCGPTVYKEAHIGHMVGPVIFDTIKRYLSYSGYDVTWVVNITDVDDKLIAEANRRGITMAQVAEENIADYHHNLSALGVDQIDHFPRATDHISGIIEFIESLISRGFAYPSEGDVYFEVGKDPNYGKLSNRSTDSLQGEGGGTARRKRAAGDFALWKSAKPDEPSWESPWGPGRPGWHIECSAMSHALLGETFDIHGGGLDLIFPHHENEIAQSECCHGKPMVNYWMHNGLMKSAAATGKVGGRSDRAANSESDPSGKISRSQGAGGLADLIGRHGGERIRFFLLRTHYRSTIVFSDEGLIEAGTALESFHRLFERVERIMGESFYSWACPETRAEGDRVEVPAGDAAAQFTACRAAFLERMNDDLNTGAAVSELFELLRRLNQWIDREQLDDPARRSDDRVAVLRYGVTRLRELTAILGIFRAPPPAAGGGEHQAVVERLMELLLELRATARKNKDFAVADRIRDGLTEAGITVEDSKEGTRWRIES